MRYREKPLTYEAMQLTRETRDEVCAFVKVGTIATGRPEMTDVDGSPRLAIPTPGGIITAIEHDWIIKNAKEELFIMHAPAFHEAFEEVA